MPSLKKGSGVATSIRIMRDGDEVGENTLLHQNKELDNLVLKWSTLMPKLISFLFHFELKHCIAGTMLHVHDTDLE